MLSPSSFSLQNLNAELNLCKKKIEDLQDKLSEQDATLSKAVDEQELSKVAS